MYRRAVYLIVTPRWRLVSSTSKVGKVVVAGHRRVPPPGSNYARGTTDTVITLMISHRPTDPLFVSLSGHHSPGISAPVPVWMYMCWYLLVSGHLFIRVKAPSSSSAPSSPAEDLAKHTVGFPEKDRPANARQILQDCPPVPPSPQQCSGRKPLMSEAPRFVLLYCLCSKLAQVRFCGRLGNVNVGPGTKHQQRRSPPPPGEAWGICNAFDAP